MSRTFAKALIDTALHAGGSHKTQQERVATIRRFYRYLQDHNIQIKHIDHIKCKHIQGFIAERKTQAGVGTLQNEMSHLRKILEKSGRHKLALSEVLSNKALGIDGRSREGTKTACPQAKYQRAYTAAKAKDPRVAAVMQLQRTFGLRRQEAIRAGKSLKTWQKAIEQGQNTVRLSYGAKGGRPRDILILDRAQALLAVKEALSVMQDGRLLPGELKAAKNDYAHAAAEAGLKGEHSTHSLRYAWAQECFKTLQSQGYPKEEALALTSQYLGHGDGRGRWLKSVYLRDLDNAGLDG
jgi:hypothetical protein